MQREIILNSSNDSLYATETLRRWNYFSGAVNKLKDLEGKLAALYPRGSILLELHRIAHRQFSWQRKPDRVWIARYFKIFGHRHLDTIIQRRIGLTARELYRIGLAFTGLYVGKYVLNYPPTVDIRDLSREKLDRFLSHFSTDLDILRGKVAEAQEINENYAYVFNPLRIYPLVWMDNRAKIIAPIPTFLLRRFTEGVYYEIREEPGFSDAFGDAFQEYVGEVIKRANDMNVFTIHPEAEYRVGKERKDTVDWVVEDRDATIFVESKTKRLRREAKMDLRSQEALNVEILKLAGFIVQVYKTIHDYREGRYPQKLYKGEPLLPIVVTLEEWYAFGDLIQTEIESKVAELLAKASLPVSWLEEMPYVTCSVEEFEDAIQVIARVGAIEVMKRRRKQPEYRKWQFETFLRREFQQEMDDVRPFFQEVLDRLVEEER